MFGNTKVKIAAGLATGALTLGAAGAYAAANNTITVANPTPITVTGGTTTNPLSLISVSGKTTTLTLPASFKNEGQCVSMFAKNKDLAIAPAAGATKLSKNYHGKLMSSMTAWCKTQTAASKTTDSTDAQAAETPDATASSTDSTDTTSATHGQSGQAHGKSQSHGHGHTGD